MDRDFGITPPSYALNDEHSVHRAAAPRCYSASDSLTTRRPVQPGRATLPHQLLRLSRAKHPEACHSRLNPRSVGDGESRYVRTPHTTLDAERVDDASDVRCEIVDRLLPAKKTWQRGDFH